MKKLAILGAGGRMGGALIRCAHRDKFWTLAAAVERSDHESVDKDAGLHAGLEEVGVPIEPSLEAAALLADAMIDFSFHEAVPEHMEAATKQSKPIVLGTTGLTDDEAAAVRLAAESVPVVWAPNMSLGVNLLFAEVRKAASVLGPGYRMEVDETHHVHKKDAPSGTALQLARKMAEGREEPFESLYVHDPGGKGKVSDPDKLVVHSRREGEVVGDHTVVFENEGERIEFTHHAWSRDAFAMGALHAARWALDRTPGLYDMQDVLGL